MFSVNLRGSRYSVGCWQTLQFSNWISFCTFNILLSVLMFSVLFFGLRALINLFWSFSNFNSRVLSNVYLGIIYVSPTVDC